MMTEATVLVVNQARFDADALLEKLLLLGVDPEARRIA